MADERVLPELLGDEAKLDGIDPIYEWMGVADGIEAFFAEQPVGADVDLCDRPRLVFVI